MSKIRYNVLRLSLGFFLGIMGAKAIRDFDALTFSEIAALGLGLFAAIVNYWPEDKKTTDADRS